MRKKTHNYQNTASPTVEMLSSTSLAILARFSHLNQNRFIDRPQEVYNFKHMPV